jgi:hypothetical protein
MCCSCRCRHTFPIAPYPVGIYYYPYYSCFETSPPPHAVCPFCSKPSHLCHCHDKSSAMLPEEIAADTANPAPPAVLIGGSSEVKLTLEYLPDAGKTTAAVTLAMTSDEGTDTVELKDIPAGYHVKDNFAAVNPGSTITLKVVDCTARLRWCEVIACS